MLICTVWNCFMNEQGPGTCMKNGISSEYCRNLFHWWTGCDACMHNTIVLYLNLFFSKNTALVNNLYKEYYSILSESVSVINWHMYEVCHHYWRGTRVGGSKSSTNSWYYSSEKVSSLQCNLYKVLHATLPSISTGIWTSAIFACYAIRHRHMNKCSFWPIRSMITSWTGDSSEHKLTHTEVSWNGLPLCNHDNNSKQQTWPHDSNNIQHTDNFCYLTTPGKEEKQEKVIFLF